MTPSSESLSTPTVASTRVRRLARVVVGLTSTLVTVVALAATAVAAPPVNDPSRVDSGAGLTVVETLLLYVVVPGVIFALIALAVVGPSLGKGSRGRTGSSLTSGPIWIDAIGAQRTPADTVSADVRASDATRQGGASGAW